MRWMFSGASALTDPSKKALADVWYTNIAFAPVCKGWGLCAVCIPSDTEAIAGAACKCATDATTGECAVSKYCWTDNTCNDAAKPSVAKLSASYVLGETGSNACPAGATKFTSLGACTAAFTGTDASAHGLASTNPVIRGTFEGNWGNAPSGCYLVLSNNRVAFNAHPTGSGADNKRVICAP